MRELLWTLAGILLVVLALAFPPAWALGLIYPAYLCFKRIAPHHKEDVHERRER